MNNILTNNVIGLKQLLKNVKQQESITSAPAISQPNFQLADGSCDTTVGALLGGWGMQLLIVRGAGIG